MRLELVFGRGSTAQCRYRDLVGCAEVLSGALAHHCPLFLSSSVTIFSGGVFLAPYYLSSERTTSKPRRIMPIEMPCGERLLDMTLEQLRDNRTPSPSLASSL